MFNTPVSNYLRIHKIWIDFDSRAKITFFLILAISQFSFSQENQCQIKLIGNWEVFNCIVPYQRPPIDSSRYYNRWFISKKTIRIGDDRQHTYVMNAECTELHLMYQFGNGMKFSVRKLTKDSLIIEYKDSPHESLVYWLKKHN
ncbi:hypothetical protein [Aquimarina aquimarini]|uniref:hypothetical protein n=1 Tax=Aquimarina aquimarini TaxID=1191734 RepID=UPI000D5553E3|nr:hypothetical protein [Aquimarina aquimarini]